MTETSLHRAIEDRVAALGYELVELERAGSKNRPVLRLRIDRPDSSRGHGVTLDDCARVSRALEAWLDETADLGPRYVLEVSSPGVERPLVRPADFRRFAGQPVALRGAAPLGGRARRLEGELVGLVEGETGESVRIRLAGGEEVDIPRVEIARANLLFRWSDG
jgi:ribosome maturation factor RimP